MGWPLPYHRYQRLLRPTFAGWRVSKSGKADVATTALEDAFIRRNPALELKLRSDNGLIFLVVSSYIRSFGVTPASRSWSPRTRPGGRGWSRGGSERSKRSVWGYSSPKVSRTPRSRLTLLSKPITRTDRIGPSECYPRLKGGENSSLSGLPKGDPHMSSNKYRLLADWLALCVWCRGGGLHHRAMLGARQQTINFHKTTFKTKYSQVRLNFVLRA